MHKEDNLVDMEIELEEDVYQMAVEFVEKDDRFSTVEEFLVYALEEIAKEHDCLSVK